MFRLSGNSAVLSIDEEEFLLVTDDDDTSKPRASQAGGANGLRRAVRCKVDKFSKPSKLRFIVN